MESRTQLNYKYPDYQYNHQSTVASIGSCFAEEMGKRLEDHLFNGIHNPFGTCFNPVSLARLLDRGLSRTEFEENEFYLHEELWRHDDLHSLLAQTQVSKAVGTANQALQAFHSTLLKTDLLLITLGTAWAYESKSNRKLVGHNHKRPLDTFEKRLLGIDEIVNAFSPALHAFGTVNPTAKVCISVSPVRHLRDGLHQNNLSKSTLLLASDKLQRLYPNIDYFPAYEILIDELRDYRYYDDDMAHPSVQSIEYTWNCFLRAYFSSECLELCKRINKIRQSISHKDRHPETEASKRRKTELTQQIAALSENGIDVSKLIDTWKS